MSQILDNILGNAVIVPDTQDTWSASKAYPKNTWVYHNNQNWTSRRDTIPGEEPGPSGAWLPGPKAGDLTPLSRLIAQNIASFDDDYFTWANNGDYTGVLTV
ncbi:hypothetical protein LJC46_04260, partial [Desulfovibrio sp. OttesenSCG-928-G15]|nr:hypothetical protein [Desulfovibrio sp. OttesenSCG-928-G15]